MKSAISNLYGEHYGQQTSYETKHKVDMYAKIFMNETNDCVAHRFENP